jgi:hypothetical protein
VWEVGERYFWGEIMELRPESKNRRENLTLSNYLHKEERRSGGTLPHVTVNSNWPRFVTFVDFPKAPAQDDRLVLKEESKFH